MLSSFEVSAAISSAGSVPAMPVSLREWRRRSPHPYPARETGGANPVFCLSVTHRRRRTWAGTAIGSVALAAVTLLGTQGCAPATSADAVTHASHSVSLAAAEAAYGSYLTASDAAAAAGNETQALSIVTAAQWAQVKGQYTALASAGTPVPRYRYGKPTFYVPALDTYPEWFLVAVPRRTDTGGRLGPAVSTLMVFAKAENEPALDAERHGRARPAAAGHRPRQRRLRHRRDHHRPQPAAAPGRGGGDPGGRGGRRAGQPGRGGGQRRAADDRALSRRRPPRRPRRRPRACSTSGCCRARPSRSSSCA